MQQAHESHNGALPNGIEDVGLNQLIKALDIFLSKKDDDVRGILSEIARIINEMEYRYGSVKSSFSEVPWDHFITIAEIINHRNPNELCFDFQKLIDTKAYQVDMRKELNYLRNQFVKMKEALAKGERTIEKNEIDITLPDVTTFDRDDSLEEDIEDYKTLRSITSFYRDHMAFDKIAELLSTSKNIPMTPTTGKVLAGIVIAIGEELKKLSPNRRDELSKVRGVPLHEHELTVLNRLWLYKKSRDSIRHAVDFPEGQLVDLKKLLASEKGCAELINHMNVDLSFVAQYCEDTLKDEKSAIKGSPEAKKKYLLGRLEPQQQKVENVKKKKEPKLNLKEEQDELQAIDPIFSVEQLEDGNFKVFFEYMFTVLNKNKKKDETSQQQAQKIEKLKKFLVTGKVDLYMPELQKTPKHQRGAEFAKLASKLSFGDMAKELKKEIGKNTNHPSAVVLATLHSIQQFMRDAIVGKTTSVGETVTKSTSIEEEKPKAETKSSRFWGSVFNDFVADIFAYAETKVLDPRPELKREVYYNGKEKKTLRYFLSVEFLGKGFKVGPKALKQLRELTDTGNAKFDEVFLALSEGRQYTGAPELLEHIQKQFETFLFGAGGIQKLLLDGSSTVKKMKSEIADNIKKFTQHFGEIFYAPEKVNIKNVEMVSDIEFCQASMSLRPWEENYLTLNNTLLSIRMLLSSRYKPAIEGASSEVFTKLRPEHLGKRFVLHFDSLFTLLKETDAFVKKHSNAINQSKTLKDVVEKLGYHAYFLVTNMAMISQHVAGITGISYKYVLPYLENPPSRSKFATVEHKQNDLVEKFKQHVLVLRTCGNSLAHMDLTKYQDLSTIFSEENFTKMSELVRSSLEAMSEILRLLPSQLRNVQNAIAVNFSALFIKEFKISVSKNQNPNGTHARIMRLAERIMQEAYPHTRESFGQAIASFGIFKKPVPLNTGVQDVRIVEEDTIVEDNTAPPENTQP